MMGAIEPEPHPWEPTSIMMATPLAAPAMSTHLAAPGTPLQPAGPLHGRR